MNAKQDRFGQLTIADLQLIARARGLDVPAGAGRDEIVALLRDHDALDDTAALAQNSARSAPDERAGWWTSLSIRELRSLARDHGIDVPAGIHRHELVELVIDHDVPRPSRPPSRATRRSR
jgi:hypothetical protein